MQYLFISQTVCFLPSCFHHTALPQTGSSDGSGPGSDFLLG